MIDIAVEAALEAGAFLKAHVGKVHQIERKFGEETNLVTEIDKESERMIIGRLRSKFPAHDFLCEESGNHQTSSEYKWVIDPLDGKINYTHALPIFSVSIGLEYKGEMLLGVVYDPNLNELFTVERGHGSFLNGQPLHVSRTDRLIESLIVTGFPYDIKKNPSHAVEHFSHFLMEAQAIRRLGSAALDLCYVAAGRFDGFWEVKLNPWDMAAGVLLVEEAGGKFTDFDGRPSTIYKKDMLATNGVIHDQMLRVLSAANDHARSRS